MRIASCILLFSILFSISFGAESDTAKINKMLKILDMQGANNREASLGLAQRAYVLAQKAGYVEGQIQAYFKIGQIEFFYNGKNDIGLSYFTKAYQLSERYELTDYLIESCVKISNVYYRENLYKDCYYYLNKAQEYAKKTENKRVKANILSRLGRYYDAVLTNEDLALDSYLKALELLKNTPEDENYGWTLMGLGALYENKNNLIVSKRYMDLAIPIFKKNNQVVLLSYAYAVNSRIAFKNSDYTKSINSAEEGLKIAVQYDLPKEKTDNALQLFAIYKQTKNAEKALYYLELSDSLDKVNKSVEQIEKIYSAKSKLKLEKQEDTIDTINQENAVYKSQKFLFKITIALIGLILLGLTLFVRNKIKSNKELSIKNEIINSQREEVSEKNKEIIDSINYSKRIQEALLPSNAELHQYFNDDFFVFIRPKDIVSGDFFWASQIGHLRFFAVADCTGHGVPGSMMSVLGNSLLNELVNEKNIFVPSKILNRLRDRIIKDLKQGESEATSKDGMDIAFCCLNTQTFELTYAGANNPIYIFKHSDEKLIKLMPNKMPIGFSYNKEEFTQQVINLEKGDHLYLFSDGFVDQFGGPKEKKFKHEQFAELIKQAAKLKVESQHELFASTFNNWKGNLEQVDDILVLGITIT